MTRSLTSLALALLALTLSCATPGRAAPGSRAAREIDALEAVYRCLLRDSVASWTASYEVDTYYVSLRDDDPPSELLKRFEGFAPSVLPLSRRPASKGGFDSYPGSQLLWVKSLDWIDDDTIECEAGTWSAPLSAVGLTIRLERRGDAWAVVSKGMKWIS